MALSAATVWEVRPATGSNNNGGGFVAGASGTDRSQQDSAQITYTDLVIDATTNTKLTSSAHAFTSAEVGNIINITGGTGFTTGRYQVVSVAAGVATMDRAVGTTSSTGGTGNLGGAVASLAGAPFVAGNTIYIKGTLTVTAATTLSISATVSVGPITFNGYSTARDDGTRATWTTATNSVNLLEFTACQGYVFKNIEMSSTAGTPGDALHAKTSNNSGGIVIDNCLIHGWNRGIQGDFITDWAFTSLVIARTRIYSCVSHGVLNTGATVLLGCYIHDNGGDGIRVSNAGGPRGITLLWRCVVKSNTGKGLNDLQDAQLNAATSAAFSLIIECDILNNGSDNVKVSRSSNPAGLVIYNSIIDAAGGYGANSDQVGFGMMLLGAIAWRANTTADTNNIAKSASDVTLTGDPFTARASDDFTLNSTAGAGAACKSIGLPATFPP
jgi:hypothetical protein